MAGDARFHEVSSVTQTGKRVGLEVTQSDGSLFQCADTVPVLPVAIPDHPLKAHDSALKFVPDSHSSEGIASRRVKDAEPSIPPPQAVPEPVMGGGEMSLGGLVAVWAKKTKRPGCGQQG